MLGGGRPRRHLYKDGKFTRICISTTPIGAPIYSWPLAAIPPAPPLKTTESQTNEFTSSNCLEFNNQRFLPTTFHDELTLKIARISSAELEMSVTRTKPCKIVPSLKLVYQVIVLFSVFASNGDILKVFFFFFVVFFFAVRPTCII